MAFITVQIPEKYTKKKIVAYLIREAYEVSQYMNRVHHFFLNSRNKSTNQREVIVLFQM